MRLRRGRICPSPVQAQPGARTPPARLRALDPVREEEDSFTQLGGGVGAEMGDRHEDAEVGAQPLPSPGDDDPIATTGPQDVGEGRGARTGAQGFNWSSDTREDQRDRRLKLAEAVRDAKAYFCRHGTTQDKWRDVVDRVKANDSPLFFALKPNSPTSSSWETLKKEWTFIFKEWKRRNDAGANTSGAAETYTALDQICQQIESLRADAEQQAKDGVRRSSFLAPRQDEINSMINGDLHGRARLVATNLGEQLQEARVSGELGDDGGETFTPAPRADNPGSSAVRSGRGGGARDAAKALASVLKEQGTARAEAQAKAQAEATQALVQTLVESQERARREDREWQEKQAAADREERRQAAAAAAQAEQAKEAAAAQQAFMLEAIRLIRWVRGKPAAHEPALPAPGSFRGRGEGRGRGGAAHGDRTWYTRM